MFLINKLLESYILNANTKEYSLDKILKYASDHTKFYANFKEFKEFPILNKDIIRNNFKDMQSDELDKKNWWINTSGGSTGEPLKLVQDKEYLLAVRKGTYLQKTKMGYRFGDTLIKLWGDEREVLQYSTSLKSKILNRIKNITFLNAFSMTPQNMRNYVNIINQKEPKLIEAYVNAIYELAKFIKKENLKVKPIPAILTSAGTLYDFMREEIQEVFQTKVYNRYGSREVGDIACDEPNVNGLVVSDIVHVEIVDENGNEVEDGVEGDILVTSLINYAMPIIRYKIGDRGILDRKTYPFAVLKKVTGRGMESFRTKEGKIIPAEFFIHIVGVVFNKDDSWIKKFQVIQEDYDRVVIKVIKSKEPTKEDMDSIINSFKKVMGDECKIEFDFTNEINPLKSGKYLYTICKIK